MGCLMQDSISFDLQGDNLDFLNLVATNNLFPLASIPTGLTSHLATLIDNILVYSEF